MIDRRRVLTGLSASVLACCPLVAQAADLPLVGFVNSQSMKGWEHFVAAFERGLARSGFTPGRTVEIRYYWGEGDTARLAPIFSDLIARAPAVIVATGGPDPALIAKRATSTIPVVFTIGPDPVKFGLVASLSQPGGNMTGFTLFTSELNPKRLEILRGIAAAPKPIAVLLNPANTGSVPQLAEIRQAAQASGVDVIEVHADSIEAVDRGLTAAKAAGAGAVFVGSDSHFYANRRAVIELMARLALPAIYEGRDFVLEGGLVSYGVDFSTVYEGAGAVAAQILRGGTPAAIPVQQPARLELVVNLKAARELGFTVPPAILLRADEVIE